MNKTAKILISFWTAFLILGVFGLISYGAVTNRIIFWIVESVLIMVAFGLITRGIYLYLDKKQNGGE